MKTYSIDYFIDKFEGIPNEKWCCEFYIDGDGRCCSLGHCGRRYNDNTSPEAWALLKILDMQVTSINDGNHQDYKQTTPKARILAALRDAKLKQDTTAESTPAISKETP